MGKEVKRPFLAATGRSCLWQIGIGAVGLLGGLCLLGVALFVANSASSNDTPEIFLALFMVALCAFIATLLVGTFGFVILRWRRYDALFEPLGLAGSAYMLISGRQYAGTYAGREVTVRIYRGPTLWAEMKGKPGGKAAFATRTGLGQSLRGIVGAEEIDPGDEAFAHLIVAGNDPALVQRILKNAGAREGVLRATRDEGAMEMRSLQFQEEALHLQIRRFPLKALETESLRAWLDAMAAALNGAEENGGDQEAGEA